MAMTLKRTPARASVAGVLASREAADAALLRMLSRARRYEAPLLLVALDWAGEHPADPGPRFLHALVAEIRIGDLAWWEHRRRLMLLLEAAPEPAAVLKRLRHLGSAAAPGDAGPRLRAARFPQQGLTLQALLEALA